MLDDIADRCASFGCVLFNKRINKDDVCRLASSFNHGKPCQIAGEPIKGSFNVSFPVVFPSEVGSGDDGSGARCEQHKNDDASDVEEAGSPRKEKWLVRFPMLPRVAFPEEKLRSEIATMKYLAERTTIPLPRIYGYGFGGNYPTGLPFLILEYVDGHRLHDMGYATLDHAQKKHLYTQLADIFLQLRQQEFDHIGALTLDDNGAWTFARNRPLTIEINDGQVDGEDPAKLVQANQIYTSSWDFFLSLLSLAFHNLIQQRDVVESEQNARWQLYGLYQFRDLVKTWHLSHYDRGPFVLTHGDLSPANIIVDQDLCIKGVIDWEWSYTLPLQLVVPPTWLTGYQLDALYGNASREHDILREWSYFQKVVMGREAERAAEALASPLLSELWKDAVEGNSKDVMPGDSVFIAHTLLSWSHTPCVYWDRFASRDLLREERFLHFFDPTENMAAEDHLRLAAKKELDREGVQLIQNDRDFWWEKVNRPRSPLPPLSSEDARHLSTFVNGFGKQSPWIMGFFQFSRRAANSFLPLWSKLGQLVFEQQPSFITEKAITPASHVAGLVTFVAVFSWLLTWRRRTKCI